MKKTILILLAFNLLGTQYFAQTISAGQWLTLFLCTDNTPRSCGINNFGELGDGTTITRNSPVQVNGLTNIISVSAGDYHSLFLKNDSTVWACGHNDFGQLGDGTVIDKSTSIKTNSLTGIIAISSGGSHSLFLKSDGTVWGCGNSSVGQLGVGTNSYTYSNPVKVNGLTGITAISAGYAYSLFLKNDGTVWGCGRTLNGEMGIGTSTVDILTPIQIGSGISGVIAIDAGQDFSLFLKSNGKVWGCGKNNSGQLGDGTSTSKNTPIQLPISGTMTAISAGCGHSMFLRNDGKVLSSSMGGSCGGGFSATLVDTNTVKNIIEISAGCNRSYYLKNNGSVFACGDNTNGILGVGVNFPQAYAAPVQIPSLCSVIGIEEIILSEESLSVFPNPTSGQITISLKKEINNGAIKLINIIGQTVFEKTNLNGNKLAIDITEQTSGVYFIELTDGKVVSRSKLIKN